jgi:hypothetical protein
MRARVGERRDAAAEAGQRPAPAAEAARGGLPADLGGQRHGMPELRERRMPVGELLRCHVAIVAQTAAPFQVHVVQAAPSPDDVREMPGPFGTQD